jgi:hypothetical protein
MRRVFVSVVTATVALVTIASCSSPSSPRRQAAPGAASTSASQAVFHRLGYSFVPPPGWQPGEGSADWEATGGPPRLDNAAFDSFVSASSDPRILVGKRPVRDSAPLDQWIAQMRAGHLITYPPDNCNAAEDERPAALGGEPAEMVAFHCPSDGPKAGIVQFLVRHGDSGWVVQCFSGDGIAGPLPGLEKQCGTWLESFRFQP